MLDPDVRRVLDGASIAHLATVLPDGSPHTTPVYVGAHRAQPRLAWQVHRVDLDAVRTFVAVADTGQFQAAGDELAITQQSRTSLRSRPPS